MSLYFKFESFASILKGFNDYKVKLDNEAEVNRRLDILKFWDKYGLEAAMEHGKCSRATIYGWKHKMQQARIRAGFRNSKLAAKASLKALDPASRRPKHCKQATWNKQVLEYLKGQAGKYPLIGKQQCYHLLRRYIDKHKLSINLPSESTIGRMLAYLRLMGRIPSKTSVTFNGRTGRIYIKKHKRKPKLRRNQLPFKVKHPGDLIQIDGIDSYHLGRHYYILNCIDYVSSVAYSFILPNKSSQSTANILCQLSELFGFEIKAIQTDNGSEFTARFHEAAERMNIKHCFNYLRKPIYNGKVERFNRTIQEAIFDEDFLYDVVEDKESAQRRIDRFIYFYNYIRPHKTMGFAPPMEFLLQYRQRKLAV